jgi:hypothetical protein
MNGVPAFAGANLSHPTNFKVVLQGATTEPWGSQAHRLRLPSGIKRKNQDGISVADRRRWICCESVSAEVCCVPLTEVWPLKATLCQGRKISRQGPDKVAQRVRGRGYDRHPGPCSGNPIKLNLNLCHHALPVARRIDRHTRSATVANTDRSLNRRSMIPQFWLRSNPGDATELSKPCLLGSSLPTSFQETPCHRTAFSR